MGKNRRRPGRIGVCYFFGDAADESQRPDDVEIKLDGFGGFTGYIQDVAISSDGRYSLLGSANSKTALIDNQASRRDAKNADVFKTRYVLMSGEKNAIFDVGFTEDDQYFITRSDNRIWKDSEQKKITGTVTHLWKTEPFPYIEIHNTSSEHQNISIRGGYYNVSTANFALPFQHLAITPSILNSDKMPLIAICLQ